MRDAIVWLCDSQFNYLSLSRAAVMYGRVGRARGSSNIKVSRFGSYLVPVRTTDGRGSVLR